MDEVKEKGRKRKEERLKMREGREVINEKGRGEGKRTRKKADSEEETNDK